MECFFAIFIAEMRPFVVGQGSDGQGETIENLVELCHFCGLAFQEAAAYRGIVKKVANFDAGAGGTSPWLDWGALAALATNSAPHFLARGMRFEA